MDPREGHDGGGRVVHGDGNLLLAAGREQHEGDVDRPLLLARLVGRVDRLHAHARRRAVEAHDLDVHMDICVAECQGTPAFLREA